MDGYRNGLTGPLLDYAVRQYSSHRKFPFAENTRLLEEIQEGYNNKKKKIALKQERLYEDVLEL